MEYTSLGNVISELLLGLIAVAALRPTAPGVGSPAYSTNRELNAYIRRMRRAFGRVPVSKSLVCFQVSKLYALPQG
jgi:hypothetical protein